MSTGAKFELTTLLSKIGKLGVKISEFFGVSPCNSPFQKRLAHRLQNVVQKSYKQMTKKICSQIYNSILDMKARKNYEPRTLPRLNTYTDLNRASLSGLDGVAIPSAPGKNRERTGKMTCKSVEQDENLERPRKTTQAGRGQETRWEISNKTMQNNVIRRRAAVLFQTSLIVFCILPVADACNQVIGWGADNYDQTNIPANVTNVTVIAAGGYHNRMTEKIIFRL
jgi:hypothetical protein